MGGKPLLSQLFPPASRSEAARKLLWNALLHKEKCSRLTVPSGRARSLLQQQLGLRNKLLPLHAWLGQALGVPSCPLPHCWGAILSLPQALGTPWRGGFIWKGTLGCVTRRWLSCSLHWQVVGDQCHPEPCSSGCICSCSKPCSGSVILLQHMPRGLLSTFLQEQLLGHVSPCWGLPCFALDSWSDW